MAGWKLCILLPRSKVDYQLIELVQKVVTIICFDFNRLKSPNTT